MKKFKSRVNKVFVFLLTLLLCTGIDTGSTADNGGKAGTGPFMPLKTLYAEEQEENREDKQEEQEEKEDEQEDNEDAQEEEEIIVDSDGSYDISNASDGRPVVTLTPLKSEEEPIDFQTVKASYQEFNDNKVLQISWGIDTGSEDWHDINEPGIMTLDVYKNCIVSVKVKAENGWTGLETYRVRNVDTYGPDFTQFSNGRYYEYELLGDTSNSRARSVQVRVDASDSGMGLAQKAYACTDDHDAFMAIKRAGRNSTPEQLAAVEWQESGEFVLDKNGIYYILARDTLNNVEFTPFTCEYIDNEPPSTEVSQEYHEVEGCISENVITAASVDTGGAGLAELPYSWNLGERTDSNTYIVRENGTVTLDVFDALGNKEHTDIRVEDHDFDTQGPVIRQVTKNSGETINTFAGNVWIKIEAQDEKVSMAAEGYSFDGGASWQSQPVKNVTANGKFNICVRDALMNTTIGEEVNIRNIDDVEPEIGRARYTLQGVKNGYAGSALISVEAEDGQSGLSSNAFSFDGGGSYQANNTFTVERNGDYEICVRDAFNNTARETVNVAGIDCTAPTISVTGNPTSAVYKAVTLQVKAEDKESGIASLWYKNDTVNIPSAIYQSSGGSEGPAASAEAVINVNGDYTFYAYDALGNVSETRVSVTKITKKKTETTEKESDDSSSGSGSGSSSDTSKTIVLPPSVGSGVSTQSPVSRTSSYDTGTVQEAESGKTVVLKGSASSNNEGSEEEGKKEDSKKEDFELELTEAGEEEDFAADLSEEAAPLYEGGLISVENTEHDSVKNEAGREDNTQAGEISEKLLMSAGGETDEKSEKSNAGIVVLICVSVAVIAGGGVTAGILIKKGVLKIPDFFEDKE
ncbi:MAG: hypothetical protein J6O71_06855 [Lachnospiraceae bacterium]|nr:hypothetical protein [Lachnospiraceae bacterium]